MSAWIAGWLAGLLSLACIGLLALRDPKRLRNRPAALRQQLSALSPSWRKRITVLALAPGVALLLLAQWAAFAIWAGAVTTLSWLMVLWLASRDESAA